MPSPPDLFPALNQAQILWLMVAMQLLLIGSLWLMAAKTRVDTHGAMRWFGVFNLLLAITFMLVGLRGWVPAVWTGLSATSMGMAAFAALWWGAIKLQTTTHQPREPVLVVALTIMAMALTTDGNHRVAIEYLGICYLVLRAWALTRASTHARYGATTSLVLSLAAVAVAVVALLATKAAGAVWLGWRIELNHNEQANLRFAYIIMALVTVLNAALAYMSTVDVLAQLESLTQRDPLTHLLNRRAYNEQLAQRWQEWVRHQRPFAAMCIDIDHFKLVNDQFGHQAGDAVLTAVSQALQSQCRPTDTLARTGGEEFVLLLSQNAQGEDLLSVAERMRQVVQDNVRQPDGQALTISVGVARCLPGDERPEKIISRADAALYRAKALGRNRVQLSDETQATTATTQPAQRSSAMAAV